MTGIVLQARLDSSRLPEKALLPLDGKPLVLRVMEALNQIHADIRILACPEDSYSAFAPLIKETGFHIFAGLKENVLERYCQVIREFSLTRVIRATGDNPFVFVDLADKINAEAIELNADYAGYLEIPYGAGVESICASSLLQASEKTLTLYEREHVCPYLYNNPSDFKIHRPKWVYPEWIYKDKLKGTFLNTDKIRLTVDTSVDYERAILLYNSLKEEELKFESSVIIQKYLELFDE